MSRYDGIKENHEKNDPIFTEREKEVLILLGQGYSEIEIGEKLCISRKTVGKHKNNMTFKIRFDGHGEDKGNDLLRFAIEHYVKFRLNEFVSKLNHFDATGKMVQA